MTRWLFRLARRAWLYHRNGSRPQDENGVSLVLIALMVPALVGFVALVLDVGMLVEVRRQLQTAVDAGALAGAQRLPNAPGDAVSLAYEYVNRNGQSSAATTAVVGTTYANNDTITVTAVRNVPLLFMPVLGYANLEDVSATATAIVGSLGIGECPLPLGIVDENSPGPQDGYGYTFGQTVVLKLGAEGNLQGNFQALAIYGPGADNFADGIADRDCSSGVSITSGQSVNTLPGNKLGKTLEGFSRRIEGNTHTFGQVVQQQADGTAMILDEDCPRLALVPVVDTLDVSGSKPVTVLGFANFFIESWTYIPPPPPDKPGPPGQGYYQVTGRFIDVYYDGDFSPYNPTGARVVRLIR